MIVLLLALAIIAAPFLQATAWHGVPCDVTLALTMTAGMLGGPLAGLAAGLLGGLLMGTMIGNLAAALAVIYGALGVLAGTSRWNGARSLPRAALVALALGVAWLALAWMLLGAEGPHFEPRAALTAVLSQAALVVLLTALIAPRRQPRLEPAW